MTDSTAAASSSGPGAVHLRALARGSALTLGGAVVSTVVGFGLVLFLTRTVDQATAGTFFAVTAAFIMLLAVAGLGTDTGLARFVLRQEGGAGAAVPTLLRVAVIPVLVVACLLALALTVSGSALQPLAWALPIAAVSDFALAATRAYSVFGPTVAADRIARPTAQAVLVAGAVALGGGSALLAAAWGGAYGVSAVLGIRALRKVLARSGAATGPAPTASAVRRDFWSFTWPRAVARISQVAIQKADVVLVALLLTPADAALYMVATRFVVFGQLASQAVSLVVQPRFTAILVGDDRTALRRVFTVATCWSVLLAWPVYLLVAVAPTGYLGWFGDAYTGRDAVWVAVLMATSMLFAVASGPVDTLLLMAGRSGLSLANSLLALAVDVSLCLLLVPRIGIAGAALAWGIAVALRCLLGAIQVHAELDLLPDLRALALAGAVPVACLAVPMLVVDRLVGLGPAAWLLVAAVAAAGYLAVVWRLRRPLAVDVFVAGLVERPRAEAVT